MVFAHVAISTLGAVITVGIILLLTRKISIAVWGWIASFFPDLPVFWLSPLGATNLGATLLVTHTVGIFLFPLILVIADILLIEALWLARFSWLPLPKNLKTAGKAARTLQKYRTLPKPIRIKYVYLVGVLAGIIHLAINLLVGFF